ncbi:CocE/NonD family hydrolase [Streptomyces sp. NPDC056337]|uniref:CocE/NonD family hydrolase n=1 Tax=Streptomyces sp. NPDC056337 TaxID=3345787 RepID=UPI0035DE8F7F
MGLKKRVYERSEYDANSRAMLRRFEPVTRVLPAGFQVDPRFRSLPVDVVFEKDVAVSMRDDVTIFVDVFRPAGAEKVPVIVAWDPHGKSRGTLSSVADPHPSGPKSAALSALVTFDGPDPAYWCSQGYAICTSDPRGIAQSDGDSVMFGRQEGMDCHDLIEWLAEQDWCSGKVGMSGISYLAVAQWFAAAEQPPSLAAIHPQEGFSDVYRDLVLRGGIPDTGAAERLQKHAYAGDNRREDILTEAARYPLINELWEDKIPRFDRIAVPAYVVAGYSNPAHAAGTFRAWRNIASAEKWLRIHHTQPRQDYHDETNTAELRRFFDHYLKGADNGWQNTPRVRHGVRDLRGGGCLDLAAQHYPPEDVTCTRFYLDARSHSLNTELPTATARTAYDAESKPGQASFTIRFDEGITLVGYPKVHLWVETEGADDMDLFVLVRLLGRQDTSELGGRALRYTGSAGRLRVSRRHLDEVQATDTVPAHSFDRVEKLIPGVVVDVEIDLPPVGLTLGPGEFLRLVVSADPSLGAVTPGTRGLDSHNTGRHVIHTGGARASYLQLPIRPA